MKQWETIQNEIIHQTIPVLKHLKTKIISSVLNLRAQPVGVPPEVMMTMTTSTTAHTPPRRSHTPIPIDESSFILKELTAKKSDNHCSDNARCNSSTTLRTISTSTADPTTTNAVAELFDDDEDNHPHENKGEDFLTFLAGWDEFYRDFVNSPTYASANSTTASNTTLRIVDDDDNDDDRSMSYGSDRPDTSYYASLRQLHQAARELEKVNHQLRQFLDELEEPASGLPCYHDDSTAQHKHCPDPQQERTVPSPPAPNPSDRPPMTPTPFAAFVEFPNTPALYQPTLCTIDNNLPQPQLCPEPQRDGTQMQCDNPPKYVPKMAPPPAPNLARPSQYPTQQPSQIDHCHLLCVDHHAPHIIPCDLSRPQPIKLTTIPNWAKPAVPAQPAVAALTAGNPHWPPPRPNPKTTPYKKKSPAKHTVMQRREKDSLRPP